MIVPADPYHIAAAIEALRNGKLVALPTETVYGLACDATNGAAVADIFSAKGRPHFNPLIAHVSSVDMAARYVKIDPLSQILMEAFWPGPLTLVLPLIPDSPVHPLATAGLSTLAVRNPRGVFSDIIADFGRPVVAPSANRSGRVSPTNAAAVADELGGQVALIVDGGPATVGIESTIIKVSGEDIFLLRPGGLERAAIEMVAKRGLKQIDQRAAIEAPGMLKSHYAPEAPVRLNVDKVEAGEALLAFGSKRAHGYGEAAVILNLSPTGDMREAARNLFNYLKQLDRSDIVRIAVEPIPCQGLGEAINDRLLRAAAPRS